MYSCTAESSVFLKASGSRTFARLTAPAIWSSFATKVHAAGWADDDGDFDRPTPLHELKITGTRSAPAMGRYRTVITGFRTGEP